MKGAYKRRKYIIPSKIKSRYSNETDQIVITLCIKKIRSKINHIVEGDSYFLQPDQILMPKTNLAFNFFVASWVEFIFSEVKDRQLSLSSSNFFNNKRVEVAIGEMPLIQIETEPKKMSAGKVYYSDTSSKQRPSFCHRKITINL